jgi:hypothetical protein
MPAQIAAELHRRALKLRVSAPANAGDVLRAEYGHELWQWVTRHEFSPPELDGVWARRAVEATADFRRIVDAVRRGASLIIFPEGIPSPDGRIGPLRPGLERLARRGRPSGLQPFALAYDPLVEGRTRVVVATRPPLAPPFDDRVGDAMLHELRRTMPLVGGQVLAGLAVRLARVPKPDEALDELERALEVARRSDRPVDPRLETGDLREPVEGALARLRRRGLEHAEVRRLALTHESAAMLAA